MMTCTESGFILIGDTEHFHVQGKPYADNDPMVLAKPAAFATIEATSPPVSFHEEAASPAPEEEHRVEQTTAAPGEKRDTKRPAPTKPAPDKPEV